LPYFFNYLLSLIYYFRIVKTQYPKTQCLNILRPVMIITFLFLSVMNRTVYFNNQLLPRTTKISNIMADTVLAAETDI